MAVRERGNRGQRESYAPARGAEALALAGVCVAIGVVLPFFIHPFGASPRVILPMHFPVFLAGILLPPVYAAVVGVMTPALSMGLTGMPTASQALRMMAELPVYGFSTAIILSIVPVVPGIAKRGGRLAAMALAMLIAMIIGRITYIIVSAIMAGFQGFEYYAAVLVLPAIPGIIAQLIIVPPLAYKLQDIMNRPKRTKALR